MEKNNRKLRKLVNTINVRASEAAKLNNGCVSVDISGLGLKGKYYQKAKEQINTQGNWMFSYVRGGTKLILKPQE
ncbi:MAG: hypothetical protein FH758_00315 [Firmicutes bacterium]|nr:hypothetical protein [Bacillota bacterium]